MRKEKDDRQHPGGVQSNEPQEQRSEPAANITQATDEGEGSSKPQLVPLPPTTNLSTEASAKVYNKPETEKTMEVHHHGHVHEKKKWKEYVFQFLMLFLAVFCGFLAEYQLEHTIENQREKKYVHSLIEDLKIDTAHLEIYINLRKEKRIMMDSLIMLLSTDRHKQYGNETYFFARHVFFGQPFVSTDGTMLQLKNAGNLRLIKDEDIINNILAYDASVKELKEWDESDTRIKTSFREIGGTIFNADQLYKVFSPDYKFVKPITNPQLITDNTATINNVVFQIQYLSLSSLGNSLRGKALKTKAERLIDLLKKEYHLK